MALRAVPDHPKFATLKAILGQPKGAVAGWLEMMWHFTGRFTPQGNIGKYTDEAIESWVEWNGEPGALVEGFVRAGWIDRDPIHRLLVHDWAQHADKATKLAVTRSKSEFCTLTVRTESPKTQEIDDSNPTVGGLPVLVPEPVPEPEPGAVPELEPCAPSAPSPQPVPLRIAEAVRPDWEADEEATIPDDLPPAPLGNFLLGRLSIPRSYGLAVKFADAVDLLARDEACARGEAARRLLGRARGDPPQDGKWRFWLEDGGWKPPEKTNAAWEEFVAAGGLDEEN